MTWASYASIRAGSFPLKINYRHLSFSQRRFYKDHAFQVLSIVVCISFVKTNVTAYYDKVVGTSDFDEWVVRTGHTRQNLLFPIQRCIMHVLIFVRNFSIIFSRHAFQSFQSYLGRMINTKINKKLSMLLTVTSLFENFSSLPYFFKWTNV